MIMCKTRTCTKPRFSLSQVSKGNPRIANGSPGIGLRKLVIYIEVEETLLIVKLHANQLALFS